MSRIVGSTEVTAPCALNATPRDGIVRLTGRAVTKRHGKMSRWQIYIRMENLDQPYVKEWFDADGMHDILMALGALEVQRFPRQANIVLWDVYGFSNGVDDLLEAMFEESR